MNAKCELADITLYSRTAHTYTVYNTLHKPKYLKLLLIRTLDVLLRISVVIWWLACAENYIRMWYLYANIRSLLRII